MGHVRVVARILDDRGRRDAALKAMIAEREPWRLPTRQGDLHRIGETPGQQRQQRGFRGGGGAGAGRPAGSQRGRLGHAKNSSKAARLSSGFSSGKKCPPFIARPSA